MEKYVVAHGSPFDKITMTGPFNLFDKAQQWASLNCTGDWWVINLQDPECTCDTGGSAGCPVHDKAAAA